MGVIKLSTPAPSLIDRIKKLMALADSACNENEAALAASHMQRLLQEHNLTRAEVEAKGEESPENSLETAQRERKSHMRSALYKYQRDLMEAIAEGNFCMHFVGQVTVKDKKGTFMGYPKQEDGTRDYSNPVRCKKARVHEVIGRSENVTATCLMYDYLMDTMNRLLPYEEQARRSEEARMWLEGCAETLVERLKERLKGEKPGVKKDQTPGLVTMKDLLGTEKDLNEDFRRGVEPGTTAKWRREREAEAVRIQTERARLVKEEGKSYHDTWYIARGLPVPKPDPVRVERGSRSNRSGGYSRSDDASWRKEMMEEDRKRHPAYQAGKKRGKDIGLGGTLGKSDKKGKKELQ